MAVSEYSFGFDPTGDPSDLGEAGANEQGPKWFREGLAKLSGQVKELTAENERLKAQQVKDQVADALKAKGYAPAAAGLYTGTPDKLDDWLTANGGALAKLPGEGQEQYQEQAPSGPPASTVPAEGQEQMQRMMEQGTQGVAAPQGSDKEIAAAIAAAQTPEEFAKLMQAHGSQYNWG
jgi:regulator of protease activity HflC (stomatin/prohibitin superfamily)